MEGERTVMAIIEMAVQPNHLDFEECQERYICDQCFE